LEQGEEEQKINKREILSVSLQTGILQ